MAPLSKFASCLVALVLASQASAHFLLNYPATVGFDDDNEGNGPCGGETVDFSKDNVTDFHVDGDSIWVTNTHPTTTFLFRASLDQTAGGNWTNLRQPIQQVGLGESCNPQVAVPSAYEGKKGVIQVIADSPDGILYQCAAVSFVSGAGPAGGAAGCKNATGVTLSYTSDAVLSSAAASNPTPSSSTNSSSGSSSTAKSSTTAKSVASSMQPVGDGAVGAMLWVALVAVGTGAVRLL